MRSAMVIASSWSCVTKIVVMPQALVQRQQLLAHLHAQVLVEVRQRLVEQQHLRLDDEVRASATRCCWPPESWFGRRSP